MQPNGASSIYSASNLGERMKHYLLTPLEAELLACYRMLDEETQDAVAHLIGSSVEGDWRSLDKPVELSLVRTA